MPLRGPGCAPDSANVMSSEMLPVERLVEEREPGLVWRHIWTGMHEVRGSRFDLHACRLVDGGQLRLYVFSDGEFMTYLLEPEHDASCPHGSDIEASNVGDLISEAISDIESNSSGVYS